MAASSRLDTIEMSAAPASHVVYVVQWEEHKFASIVSYASGGDKNTTDYTYTLRIPKISDSYQLDCRNSAPTEPPA